MLAIWFSRPRPVTQLCRKRSVRPVALCLALLVPLVFCVPAAAAPEEDGAAEGPAEPEEVVLETADGVRLAATYYPGGKGQETVPVILLHMYERDRNDFSDLAPQLQSLGHAVLVPDLRGHGDSTAKKGARVPLSAASLARTEFMNMVQFDMQRLRAFLLSKNNAGELNIEKLCVVGAEMGASVALSWARFDWSLPTVGHKKQGQDVKALVLISPEWSRLPLKTAMTGQPLTLQIYDPQLKKVFKEPDEINFQMPVQIDFRKEVSVLIVVGGEKSKAVSDAQRLHKMLKPFHPPPPTDQRATKQDLFYGALGTSLQGTQMLGAKLNLERHIAKFIQLRLVNRSFPWQERKDPYEGR